MGGTVGAPIRRYTAAALRLSRILIAPLLFATAEANSAGGNLARLRSRASVRHYADPGLQKTRFRKQRVAKTQRQLKGVQQPVGRKEHMAQTEEAAAAAAVAVVGSPNGQTGEKSTSTLASRHVFAIGSRGFSARFQNLFIC